MVHPFRLPDNSQRLTVVGRTGSGKTQFGTWVLSHASYDRMPWVIIDYKGDDLINSIPHAEHISFHNAPPKHPGIYIVHPRPEMDDDAIDKFLWKIWEKRNTGVFYDEGYLIPKGGSFNSILTQGRSLKIPAIVLSQRPAFMPRFVFSEADYYAIFHLNIDDDWKRIRNFVPAQIQDNPPEYCCYWYDVKKNKTFLLSPVNTSDIILERFESRLKPKRLFF